MATSSPRPQRKNISLKLKTPAKAKRGRKLSRSSRAKKEENETPLTEEDILDTPIFKSMETGEPFHQSQRLRWDHKVHLLGEKVVDPLIHCCEICSLPILIYGRMIQCKHVFCFNCAKKTERKCPRCGDPVQRIEQSALGTVFICTFGGTKHGASGCRRTYLSQRDLNAHIGHRHLKSALDQSKSHAHTHSSQSQSHQNQPASQPTPKEHPTQSQPHTSTSVSLNSVESYTTSTSRHHHPSSSDLLQHTSSVAQPRSSHSDMMYQQQQQRPQSEVGMLQQQSQQTRQAMPHLQGPPPILPSTNVPPPGHPHLSQPPPALTLQQPVSSHHDTYQSSIPVMTTRTNLITIPIQDDSDYRRHDQGMYHSMPPNRPPLTSFQTSHQPPISLGPPPPQQQYPQVSINPSIRQTPPPNYSVSQMSLAGQVPTYSTQSVQPSMQLPNTAYTASVSHPPTPRPGAPSMGTLAPVSLHNPAVPPPRMNMPGPIPTGQPPPRFPGTHGHYEDTTVSQQYGQPSQQSPHMHWSGPPPRGPPPPTGPRPTGAQLPPPIQRPPSDYKYY
ncbi:hypothetical protein CHS0354_039362 [Potamilus streckersoni]|uniref:E3 ubiquitin-protein ligase Hakai n=1 Tax=Potamilus streckersoni TaxID=2493646 RepID=A0AAE0T3Z2_9BIVA|nr:hypothetical protein CHS0354_039362 [Potamilus streckersoni]